MGQGVNDVAGQALQTELKHLEQPHRAGANDDCIGLQRGRVR